jgi:hypothetical protein
MRVYFWKKNGEVFHFAASTEAEAKRIAEKLNGFTTAPLSSCTVEEWEEAENTAHVDGSGHIVLDKTPEKQAEQQKSRRLEEINTELAKIDASAGPRSLRDIALAQKAVLGAAAAKAIENLEEAEARAAPLRTERATLVA